MRFTYNQLSSISEKIGDSFYVFSSERLRQNFTEFEKWLKHYYANSVVAYAYKANYAPFVVRQIETLGGYAEVVSTMEYEIAIQCGVPDQKIIFNGPYKTEQDILKLLNGNAKLHIDSLYEVDMIKQLLDSGKIRKAPVQIGLRLNFELAPEVKSRFGIDIQQVDGLLDTINKDERIHINGLHCHYSTRAKSLAYFEKILETLISLNKKHFHNRLDYLDVGGGFFGPMPESIKKNFSSDVPSFKQYAQVLGQKMLSEYPDQKTQLIIEPGVSLIGDTMQYITRVIDTKMLGERHIAQTSGSVHTIKPANYKSIQPFEVVSTRKHSEPGNFTVVGYTCMETDIIYENYPGTLHKGDFLVFPNKGAYTNVFKPPFIYYAPPIIELTGGDDFVVLRKKESLSDILTTYV